MREQHVLLLLSLQLSKPRAHRLLAADQSLVEQASYYTDAMFAGLLINDSVALTWLGCLFQRAPGSRCLFFSFLCHFVS